MFSSETQTAALSTALSLVIGLPALAQSYFAIDSAGNLINSSGQTVRKTRKAPHIVPLSSLSAPTVDSQASLSPAADTDVITKIIVTKTAPSGWVQDPPTFTTVTKRQSSRKFTDTFDTRRIELGRQITFINDLPLNMSLRARLLEIAAKEATLKSDDCLTYEAAVSLAQDFDRLSNQVYSIRQTERLSPLVITNFNGSREIAVTDLPL